MPPGSKKPRVIYAANARVWLAEIGQRAKQPARLADIPDEHLKQLHSLGVDLLWLIGVWPTGARSTETARSYAGLQAEYRRALPNFDRQDVAGSPYAVAEYAVDPALGGDAALAALRERLRSKGIGLVLDFIVNHTGLDHRWLTKRPELYVQLSADDLAGDPDSFFKIETKVGSRFIAHGRDPYFPCWTDTAQLNLMSAATHQALAAELQKVAAQCDGVRCDMAMLALRSVYRQTWDRRLRKASDGRNFDEEFWPRAIRTIRSEYPNFLFVAEVFWELESELRQSGFQYTYDRTLYDRLVHGTAEDLRLHLSADIARQTGCVRFLETHDEIRTAVALPWDRHKAAAVLAGTVPGLTLFHDGQFDGRAIKVPIQLRRRPVERTNEMIRDFYQQLLTALAGDDVVRRGIWSLLPLRPAWPDNPTWANFIAYFWKTEDRQIRLIVVNFGPVQGQCYVDLHSAEMSREATEFEFRDVLSKSCYTYGIDQLLAQGLYLDMPAFGFHMFLVRPGDSTTPQATGSRRSA